ncbi:MAG TPA: tetratricopeptide repeat protein [Bryobacteraceae bacterium]
MPRSRPKPPAKPTRVSKVKQPARLNLWICFVLLATTCAVYAPVRDFDFVNFDDPDMVSANPHVRQGAAGFQWAFTSTDAANWFPVTRLSHLLDYQLFGLRSGWHHAVNVVLHALAALMLFLFLNRATCAPWPSALVAFLFALHPLHVESVAWVSERKDVLSALFWFLALWAYVRYTESPAVHRYLAVLAWFVLGLMAKPMIVTLPIVLLLLDLWPLGRPVSAALLREKAPLFALSALAASVTYLVQLHSGAVGTLAAFPVSVRVENALTAYCAYIGNVFWPSGLAIFYPYSATITLWQPTLAAVALTALSLAALRAWRRAPYLAIGWAWYLATLLPVIGLVQVGAQARADRYTYVPSVGLTIALVWGAAGLLRRWPAAQVAVAAVVCLACLPATAAQLAHWRNSETLFRHALAVTSRNDVAEHNLGNYLMAIPGRLPEAIAHLEASVRIYPPSAKAHTDLGAALSKSGRLPEALAEFQTAVRLAPDSAIPRNGLGNVLVDMGRVREGITEYRTAARLAPDSAIPHNNLGNALARTGLLPEAIAEYETALRLDPEYAEAHNNLGVVLSDLPGRLPDAQAHLEAAMRLRPDSSEAHLNLGIAMSKDPARLNEAIGQLEAAVRLDPDSAAAHYNLGAALSRAPGRLPEALAQMEAALRLQPGPELRQAVEQLRAGAR